MAMSGGRGAPGRTTMSEINVTPMVDVMLVLLVIFMVTAPLIQQGVKVNLPDARAQPVEATEKRLVLSIDRQGHIFLGDAEVALGPARGQAALQRQGASRQGNLPPRRPGRALRGGGGSHGLCTARWHPQRGDDYRPGGRSPEEGPTVSGCRARERMN